MREKIRGLLDSLRFKGMAQVLDQELDRAEREGTAVSEVIYRLLLKEIQCRKERSQGKNGGRSGLSGLLSITPVKGFVNRRMLTAFPLR